MYILFPLNDSIGFASSIFAKIHHCVFTTSLSSAASSGNNCISPTAGFLLGVVKFLTTAIADHAEVGGVSTAIVAMLCYQELLIATAHSDISIVVGASTLLMTGVLVRMFRVRPSPTASAEDEAS